MEVWERQLARAWRTAVTAGVDAEVFEARLAKVMGTQQGQDPVCIFEHSTGFCDFSAKNMPSDTDVKKFYNNCIRHQQQVLPVLLQSCAALTVALPSAEYEILATSFAWFLRKRFEAFLKLLPGQRSKWKTLQNLRLENCHRLLDETTWDFIGHYHDIAKLASIDYSNLIFYLVRVVFCCLPQAYKQQTPIREQTTQPQRTHGHLYIYIYMYMYIQVKMKCTNTTHTHTTRYIKTIST